MITGVTRVCYRRKCKFYLDDSVTPEIIYYYAPPGAQFFEGPSPFWPYNEWRWEVINDWTIGETTKEPIRYYNGALPHAGIVGDHYEGSLDDFAGLSRRPGSHWRPYEPPPVPPACDFVPALGLQGGDTLLTFAPRHTWYLGLIGGAVQLCPPSAGVLGLQGGEVSIDFPVGFLGLQGGEVSIDFPEGFLGLSGGGWCGPDPHGRFNGLVSRNLSAGLTLAAVGTVAHPALLGTLTANLPAGLTLAGAGIVARLHVTGTLAQNLDAGLSLAGAGAHDPGPIGGTLTANLDAGLTLAGAGETVGPFVPGMFSLFSTGLNAAHIPLSGTCPDELHWTINGATPKSPETGYPGWVNAPADAPSRWLTPDCWDSHPLGIFGVYTYATTFSVDVGTVLLGYSLRCWEAADDEVLDVKVNGVSTGYSSSSSWTSGNYFTIDAMLLTIGANTLEVIVRDDVAEDWTGLRFAIVALVPTPDRTGTLTANLPAGLSLAGAGAVTAPDFDRTGTLTANLPAGLSLAGAGAVTAPDFDRTGTLTANLPAGLSLAGAGAVTAPAFDMDTVTGLWVHVDFSGTVYQDSGQTTPATSDGDPIGALPDLGPNNYDLTQSSAGNRPTLKLGIQNGLNVGLWDGSDVWVTNQSMTAQNQPLTAFIVMRNLAPFQPWVFFNSIMQVSDNSGVYLIHGSSGNATGGTTDTSWHLFRVVWNGNQCALYRDGVSQGINTINIGSDTTGTGFTIGNAYIGTIPVTGYYGEVAVYQGDISASIADIETYLMTKWGL